MTGNATATGAAGAANHEPDVAVVGGGPAGCAAAIFTARYGLETVVFDRGRASLPRCGFLENYLGFPAGIDVETAYGLFHDHVAEAGGEVVESMVTAVERTDDGFVVRTQDDSETEVPRVVAATRYGGEYLRGLDDPDAMFETVEHGGETHERFDRTYAEADGTTPVEGLYVASPSADADRQALVAAGRGARVGLAVVSAVRRDRGYPASIATHYDWVRRAAERDEEWADRDRWRTWFDDRLPDDHDLADDRRRALREREVDRRMASYYADDAIAEAETRGQERLVAHLDDEAVLERAREIETAGTSPEVTEGGE